MKIKIDREIILESLIEGTSLLLDSYIEELKELREECVEPKSKQNGKRERKNKD